MAQLIGVKSLTKAFGVSPLFRDLSFSLEDGERVGLVGPNGAGKSTLLRILAGQQSQDSGEVVSAKGLKIGFLEQVSEFEDGKLVKQEVTSGELLSRFGLKDKEDQPIQALSGGWKKRVALAREVQKTPDLLLLDEPTNHLDLESILWLEKFLASSRFGILAISHDRAFLKNFSNRMIEINRQYPSGLLSVKGGYEAFVYAKESLLQDQKQSAERLRNVVRRETEWLQRGAKARTTKQQARIGRAEALQGELKEVLSRTRSASVQFEFGSSTGGHSPKKLIEAQGISKHYNGRLVVPLVDLLITPQTRLGILGINGSGKSTLIRMLCGQEESDTGNIRRADGLQIGIFEQNRESLDPEKTLLKTLCPTGDTVLFQGRAVHIRSYLDRFLFNPSQAEMKVGKLSGGEQSRVLLAKLMLQNFQVLVLDEPTNDLDFDTLEVLREVLERFEGGLLVVSHDRFFLDQVCNGMLAFEKDQNENPILNLYADIWQWLDSADLRNSEAAHGKGRKGAPAELKKSTSRSTSPSISSSTAPSTAFNETLLSEATQTLTESAPASIARKLTYKEEREWESMESNILSKEEEIEKLMKEIEGMQISQKMTETTQRLATLQQEVEHLYMRWAELDQWKKAYEKRSKK